MKKEEFIKKLKEKLSILDEKEIEDIITEYTEYIEEKMQNGATEEEAIKDFGSIEELTTELLKAYKINVKQNTTEKNWILKITESISLWMDELIKLFSNKTGSEIVKIIFEILIIIALIALCQIPFSILENLGKNVFLINHSNIGMGLYRIWKTIIELAYIIFAVVLFIKILEKRYLKNQFPIIETPKQDQNLDIQEKQTKSKKKSSTIKEEKRETHRIIANERRGIIDLLATICLYFVKFIVFWIEFGIGFFLLGLGMCFGICVFLIIKGVPYYGIYGLLFIGLLFWIVVFIWLFNFLSNRKNNVRFLMISFIICFILAGICGSFASVEIATTEFMNQTPPEFQENHITKSITMNKEYIFMETVEYIEDETLTNDILIDFTYFPDFYTLNPEIELDNNQIYLFRNTENERWNTKLLDVLMENLKDRRLYNYNFYSKVKIYTSKENIEKLKENRQKWIRRKSHYDIYDCEEEYQRNGYGTLNDYCKEIIENKL